MQITEQLEFKTQIHNSWNNTEQRMALRKYPRRYISYEYVGVHSWQSQYLRALLYNKQTEQIEIPLWHAAGKLPAETFLGQTDIALGIDKLWAYRGCPNITLWKNDMVGGERYALQQLLGDGTIKLGEQLFSLWARGTIVCPVTYGILQQEDKYELYSSASASMQINVEVMSDYLRMPLPVALDETHYEPWQSKNPWQDALPGQYMGVDLFGIGPAWSDNISASFSRNANKLDNDSGVVKYDLKSVYTSESREIDYVALSRSEINNLQRFFCRCKGRLKSFWAPTWLSDMVLAATAEQGQSYLLVEWPLFWRYYRNLARRKTVVVFLRNGSIVILPIAGFTVDDTGNYGKVILETPLKFQLRKDAVAMISFLCRYRFDTDVMTTNYETTDVASTSFSFAEVNE